MHGTDAFDCDYLIVGSGFGGSVSACRLTEQGYDVVVLEHLRRWHEAIQEPRGAGFGDVRNFAVAAPMPRDQARVAQCGSAGAKRAGARKLSERRDHDSLLTV